jgi:Glycine-rich domain-containing protein-like
LFLLLAIACLEASDARKPNRISIVYHDWLFEPKSNNATHISLTKNLTKKGRQSPKECYTECTLRVRTMAPLTKEPFDSSVVVETSSSPLSLSLSTDDLITEALKHVAFLRGLHELSITITKPSRKSLDRYLNYWLPLVAAHHHHPHNDKDEKESPSLIPPPDIAWLWHCHRLAPARYEKHVQHRFQRLVEPTPRDAFHFQIQDDQRVQAQQTRSLWDHRYSPNEPFFLDDDDAINSNNDDNDNDYKINMDAFLEDFELIESTERQATFLWQVSGTPYHDLEFLQQGVEKYIRFLRLFRHDDQNKHHHHPNNSNKSMPMPLLVPTYQLDLIWHTHMLNSLQLYNKDCIRIAGMRIHHDDSLNDRTDGGMLDQSFQATALLWKETYGEEYAVYGGMYQGEPPAEYWYPHWKQKEVDLDKTLALVAGSFSMGKKADPNVPTEWLVAGTWLRFEGQPTFLPARAKSKTRGVNNNEKKDNYVFGVPTGTRAGVARNALGHYHIYTREGWSILIKRLEKQAGLARSEADGVLFWNCACGKPKTLGPHALTRYEALNSVAEQMETLVVHAKAQYETSGPGAPLSDAMVEKYRLQQKNRSNDGSSGGDYAPMYWGAAGCGGGTGGGGCGGGGCGGGGCGGGGCGGGGCGG